MISRFLITSIFDLRVRVCAPNEQNNESKYDSFIKYDKLKRLTNVY
jgi:hypothetical protein